MSKISVMHPVAEIHWRSVIRRFGFTDSSCVERHWNKSCTNYTNVLLDPDTCVLKLLGPENTEPLSVSLAEHSGIKELLEDGYKIDSRPLWRRSDLCILKAAKRLPSYPRNNAKFAIIGIDTYLKLVLGMLKLETNDGKDVMRDIEIWDGIMSRNKEVMGLSVGMVKHSHAIFEAFETFVTIFDVHSQNEIKRYNHLDNIMCAIDFDPRIGGVNYAIAGVCADNAHSRYLATYMLNCDEPLKKRSIETLIDSEADNEYYLSYTRDGQFIVLQVLEGLGYSDEWLFNTYIFNSDSLDIIGKLRPSMASGCHPNCTPLTRPIQSCCGDFLALPNAAGTKKRRDFDIIIYRLPCQVNLMHQCRSVLLRNLRSVNDINKLNLPSKLTDFLADALSHEDREKSNTECK